MKKIMILGLLLTGINGGLKMEKIMPKYSVNVYTLPNGMKVIVTEVPENEMVAIQFWVQTGSADETETESGIAHVLEHMAFKGSEKVPGADFAGKIEGLGGYINAFTSSDNTVYHITIHKKNFEEAIKILSDVITAPLVSPEELKKELEVILEEWRRGEDIPEVRLYKEFFLNAYKIHPYRNPTIGKPETISSFKREDVLNFMKKWYYPENSFLVIAGGINPESAFQIAKKYFGEWKREKGEKRKRVQEPQQNELKTFVVKGNFAETRLMIGFHTVNLRHPDAPVLDLISSLFTQIYSSRLNKELYLKKNLVHNIFSYSYTPYDDGIFIIGASLDAQNVEKVIKELTKEIKNFPWIITEEDLANAKISTIKSYLLLNQRVDSLAREIGFFTSFAGDPSAINSYIESIVKTSIQDVKRVFKKYFKIENMTAGLLLEKGSEEISENTIKKWIEEIWGAEKKELIKSKETLKDEIIKVKLSNGPVVLMKKTKGTGTIDFTLYLKGGVLYEPEDKVGISNFIARTLPRGTEKFSQEELMVKLDEIGGSFSASAGSDSFVIGFSFLKGFEEEGMNLLMEILLNPSFPDEEIEKVRKQIVDDIKAREDYLPSLVRDGLQEGLYKNHPFRFNPLGTTATVQSITREDLIKFWKKMMVGENIVAGVVGDFDDEFENLLIKSLAEVENGVAPSKPLSAVLPPTKVEEVVKQVERKQVHIMVGFLTVPINHPDIYPLIVLDGILSGQGGRIFRELRDEKALAYALTAISFRSSEPGYIAVYLGCDPSKYGEALRGIIDILNKLEEDLTEDEVNRAKNMLIGNYWIWLQSTSSKSDALARSEFYKLGYNGFRNYEEYIKGVTIDDVKKVIRRYITPDRYVISIVGNFKKNN
jgi:zinc protease